jgi:hypothetical protein
MTFPADGVDLEFEGKIITPNATVSYTLQPNTLATNQTSVVLDGDGTAASSASNTDIHIDDVTATATVYFHVRVITFPGVERLFILHVWDFAGTTQNDTLVYLSRWNVTTAITAIRIHASTATGLQVGTTMRGRTL